jgi:predicted GNAT family N-acyltransferase
VDSRYHRRGIGGRLFETALENSGPGPVTVNSSPYAAEVYRHLGFKDTAPEQLRDGIRYIPMEYKK